MKASPRSKFMRTLQVGSLLGFAFFLWGVSLVPIQRVGLVCECVILVSARQHAILSEMSGKVGLVSPALEWLVCEQASVGAEGPDSGAEIAARRVRLRLGLLRRSTVLELEQELDRLSASSRTWKSLSGPALRAVSSARWQLKVAEHARERFELDCARQGIDALEESDHSPFQLVSQTSERSASLGASAQRIRETLEQQIEASRRALSNAESMLHKPDNQSLSVLSMVGNPRYSMHGGMLDRFRASVVLLTSLGIIGAVSIGWIQGLYREQRRPAIPARQDFLKMLDSLRIPYLGVLTDDMSRPEDHAVNHPPPSMSRSRLQAIHRLSFCSRCAHGILAFWLVCFAIRYLMDPLWRELLFQAPLAAFSCVLFGI